MKLQEMLATLSDQLSDGFQSMSSNNLQSQDARSVGMASENNVYNTATDRYQTS